MRGSFRRACSSDGSAGDGTEILDGGMKNSELIIRNRADYSPDLEGSDAFESRPRDYYPSIGQNT